jgi:hypothetical protein
MPKRVRTAEPPSPEKRARYWHLYDSDRQRDNQAKLVEKYGHEQLSDWGKKGWKTTVERHGEMVAFEQARQKRLERPTEGERIMESVLKHMRIPNRREEQIGDTMMTRDFYLTQTHQTIEVRGGVHDIDPLADARQWASKRRRLEANGETVLVVEEKDLKNPEKGPEVLDRIRSFVRDGFSTVEERLKERDRAQEQKGPARNHGCKEDESIEVEIAF